LEGGLKTFGVVIDILDLCFSCVSGVCESSGGSVVALVLDCKGCS